MTTLGTYSVRETIGAGSYSKVKYVVDIPTNTPWAMKIMDRKDIKRHNMADNVVNEITAMKLLHHDNVVQLKETVQTARSVLMVMELITGGELFDRVVANSMLTEAVARNYFQQLVMGLTYCHAKGVAHRDLKPENLLLDKRDVLKISDFGLCSIFPEEDVGVSDRCHVLGVWGTPNYMAPEVLDARSVAFDPFKADIWSLGVILYVMVCGTLPFHADTQDGIFKRIKSCDLNIPSRVSKYLVELLHKFLVVDPNSRVTLKDLPNDPWFAVSVDRYKIPPPRNMMSQHQMCASPKSSPAQTTLLNAFDIVTPYIVGTLGPVVSASPCSSIIRVSTKFVANATVEELLVRTKKALAALHCEYKVGRETVLKGTHKTTPPVSFVLAVLPTVCPRLCMMEARRVGGEAHDYFHFYYLFCVQIQDLIPHLPHDPTHNR